MGATSRALDDGRLQIHLPGATRLEGWKAEALLIALETALAPFGGGLLLPALRLAANTANVTIGIGPVVGGGLLAGGSLGAGIVFSPGNVIGFYGATEASQGLIASISATLQVTVVGGGIENFTGDGYAVGISAGEEIVGGVAVLLTNAGSFQGVSFQVGVGIGLSPVDIYTSAQRTYSTSQALALAGSRGLTTALGFSAFNNDAVERMQREFAANVAAGSPKKCIVITNAGLRQLFGPALKNADGSDKRLGTSIQDTMAALQGYGLAEVPTVFEFKDANGRLTRGVVRPETLRESVETWLLNEADRSQASAWYVFGLSIMDGYHSVVVALSFNGLSDPLTKIYWADQIYSGWDDITGRLDARITERTKTWWDGAYAAKGIGFKTRATVWPLVVGAPAVSSQGLSMTRQPAFAQRNRPISMGRRMVPV
jgi:hypothetical protein